MSARHAMPFTYDNIYIPSLNFSYTQRFTRTLRPNGPTYTSLRSSAANRWPNALHRTETGRCTEPLWNIYCRSTKYEIYRANPRGRFVTSSMCLHPRVEPGPDRAGARSRAAGTWRGRGAAHAPASILVRPPRRGYHCNMAATHFLAEVLR